MKTKTIKKYARLGDVYFPANTDGKAIQRWLRARGFRATLNAVRYSYAFKCPAGVMDFCESVTRLVRKFRGAEHAATTKVSAETLHAAYLLLLERLRPYLRAGQALPELILKTARRGYAAFRCTNPWISIPIHALRSGEIYTIYYVAHELAHHAFGGIGHGQRLCEVERALLAPFDITIEYRGGRGADKPWYPRRLVTSAGAELYKAAA